MDALDAVPCALSDVQFIAYQCRLLTDVINCLRKLPRKTLLDNHKLAYNLSKVWARLFYPPYCGIHLIVSLSLSYVCTFTSNTSVTFLILFSCSSAQLWLTKSTRASSPAAPNSPSTSCWICLKRRSARMIIVRAQASYVCHRHAYGCMIYAFMIDHPCSF